MDGIDFEYVMSSRATDNEGYSIDIRTYRNPDGNRYIHVHVLDFQYECLDELITVLTYIKEKYK